MSQPTALAGQPAAPAQPQSRPEAAPDTRAHPPGRRTALVEIVVPVYNEEHVLAASVRRLHAYLTATFPYRFTITVADNASTDATWQVATALSTELPLVAPLLSGHSDLAIGSRLHRDSAVVRGLKREFISRTYNLLLRTTMAAGFSDAQCGFKAARTDVVKALLGSVEDQTWFFDTELLLLAERSGLRIHEVPVDWVDDPDSRVDIVRTVKDDLRGMWRVAGSTLSGGATRPPVPPRGRQAQTPPALRWQLSSFAVIGVVSTLAYLALYLILRQLGPAVLANGVALFATAIANTAANRRFTFGVAGSRDAFRHQVEGGVAFLIGLVLSTATLAVVHATAPGASRLVELAALVGANALSTVVRFLLMRVWVFNPERRTLSPE